MNIQLLGPEGVMRRMEEIQSRLAAMFPPREPITPSASPLPGGPIGGARPLNPYGAGISLVPDQSREAWQPQIREAAEKSGLDPLLLDAVVAAESGYDPNARSRAGALGLTQLMPDTARMLGVLNPFDPSQSLRGGATYLSQLMTRFGGDLQLALAAYNAGPNSVERFGGVPPYAETRAYVDRVMALYNARKTSP
jgi:soluble lytic murein transglycosylase-like protein